MDETGRLIELQDGMIARHQAIAAGMTEVGIARLIRRREGCACIAVCTSITPGR